MAETKQVTRYQSPQKDTEAFETRKKTKNEFYPVKVPGYGENVTQERETLGTGHKYTATHKYLFEDF